MCERGAEGRRVAGKDDRRRGAEARSFGRLLERTRFTLLAILLVGVFLIAGEILRRSSVVEAADSESTAPASTAPAVEPGEEFTLHSAGAPAVSPYENYYGLWFVDQELGWVVGNYGSILHTTDGGAKWMRQSSPTDEPLFDVQFVDADHGWVVGKSGTILATADGGQRWAIQPSGTKNLLSQVHFVDTQKGWAVGEWGTILHTDDGGAHWKEQRPEQDVILNGVWFADAEHGWIVGEMGTVLATADGGNTWTKQGEDVTFTIEEPTTKTSLGFHDLTLYRVVFHGLDRGWIAGIDGTIFYTEDGGQHWTGLERPVDRSLFDLRVDPSGVGWAVGLSGGYAMTTDGGHTWKQVRPSPLPTSFWLYRVQFVDAQNGWIVGAHGTLLHSSDGGKTWKTQG